MRYMVLILALMSATLQAEGLRRPSLYQWSLGSVAAAHAVDIHSSWGKYEANPVLGYGTFDSETAAKKTLMVVIGMAAQRALILKWPSLKRPLTWVNFGTAAALGGVAAHNYGVHR